MERLITEAGLNGLWHDVYLLYAIASLIVLLSCLMARMAFGASPDWLIRTRCYELPPFRLIFHGIHAGLWAVAAVALILVLRHGWAYYQTSGRPHLETALTALCVGAAAGLIAWAAFIALIRIPDNRPPTAEVRGVVTREGIDPHRLANLGREQFPQMLAYGETAGLWTRGVLMTVGFSCVAFAIAASTEWGQVHGWRGFGIGAIEQARGWSPSLPRHWAASAAISSGVGLALLLLLNSTYTLMRFPLTLLVAAVLAGLAWSSLARLDASHEQLAGIATGAALAFGIRWGVDLNRAARFAKIRSVALPIVDRIAAAVPPLNGLRSRRDCRLVALDEAKLRDRITQGCRNVEEASPLVTRNLARFLELARIEYEHFVAAMLRYLTVRRFVTTSGGGGTPRGLQHPVVPMWNETLFPVRPPQGFRDWLDPLLLGSQWDIVSICSPCVGSGQVNCSGCGGSGQQQKTETHTEYGSNGQSTTRTTTHWVTCSGCGGSGKTTCGSCAGYGRVVYHQTLNTQWQRLLPTCTSPSVHLPEFMEDAEERVYFRAPLVENRQRLAARPVHDGIDPDLERELTKTVRTLLPELPEFAHSVERLHDGIIYRSDFQVTGFWTLRIGFQRLPGKVGWFFGSRPEFHFPTLPLAWGTVGTAMFVAPFAIMTGWLAAALITSWLRATLPLLP